MKESKLPIPTKHLLKFGIRCSSPGEFTATFALPSGWTCPAARQCQSKADIITGRITDGPHMEFRCFSASEEADSAMIRRARHHNLQLLKSARTAIKMLDLIEQSLPHTQWVKVHAAGDFFSWSYFLAWLQVAQRHPAQTFYAYTKELRLWTKAIQEGLIPRNFVLTASKGGKYDHLIERFALRQAVVVNLPEDAEANGWLIDHDDALARAPNGPATFAQLLHGNQNPSFQPDPKGGETSVGKKRL